MLVQLVSVAGALVVLFAYWMQQQERWKSDNRWYLMCNALGTLVLTVVAWIGSQWGFLLIEGIWSLLSFHGLWRSLRTTA
jgi:hypothetical protein